MVAPRCRVFDENVRNEALLVIQLQEWLMGLDAQNYDITLDSILHSVFVTSPSRVEQLEQSLITAITYRSTNISLYARFTKDLTDRASSPGLSALKLFKGLILKTLHLFLNGEIIFPVECVDLPFIYQLAKEGALTMEEAVAGLENYASDTAMNAVSLCWMFAWFAPEIERLNHDLFVKLAAVLKRETSMDSLVPFQDFVLELPELSDDGWVKLRDRRNDQETPAPLRDVLRFDRVDELRVIAAHPTFDVNAPVRPSVFEYNAILLSDPTPVCYAAFYGAVKCCQFLILEGCDLTKTDSSQRTLAQFAVAGGNVEVVRLLENNGCDFADTIKYATEYHQSPILRWLCRKKFSSVAIVPLMFHKAAYANNVKHVMYCLAQGVDANLRDSAGKTPLHIAAEGGFLDVLNILLSLPDIDVNASDLCLTTPLHCAAIFGRTFSVRLLLNHPKINVNQQDKWGKSPLHWAASRGHSDAIEELLRRKDIDVNIKDNWNNTPLLYLAGTPYIDALKLLLADRRTDIPREIDGGSSELPEIASLLVEAKKQMI